MFEHGVFEIVDYIPPNSQVFKTRFVDEVKHAGTEKAFEKSRLVVQGYGDSGKDKILTQAPTIQRASQRILLSLASSFYAQDMKLYLRDISQAYTQSQTRLTRDIYLKPPAELGLQSKFLWLIQPLYGLAESGTHWYNTYHKHHIEKLDMEDSTFDPCLLIEKHGNGVIGMQTDDTLLLANTALANKEEAALTFSSKPRQELLTTSPILFNGAVIQLHDADNSITISQTRQISKIELAKDYNSYIAQRARGAYIATVSQPERAFGYSFAAQITNSTITDKQIDFLNKQLSWQLNHPERGLRFVPLDLQTLRVAVFTDSSFANNHDMSSQIGYVVITVDKDNRANIIHWSSVKCKRVTRSVLAAELYAMSLGFDNAAVIKSTIQQILRRPIDLTIYIDSKSLYDCLVRLGTTHEKRLMIDIMCLRQAYERREISQVVWIDGKHNIADAMTKEKPGNSLKALIDSNRLDITDGTIGWVDRVDIQMDTGDKGGSSQDQDD